MSCNKMKGSTRKNAIYTTEAEKKINENGYICSVYKMKMISYHGFIFYVLLSLFFVYPFVVKIVLLLGIKKKDFAMAFMCHRSSFITFKVIQNMS